MNDTYLLYFGILVIVLFLIGLYLTISEFQNLNMEDQERYVTQSNNMNIKDK